MLVRVSVTLESASIRSFVPFTAHSLFIVSALYGGPPVSTGLFVVSHPCTVTLSIHSRSAQCFRVKVSLKTGV